MNQVKENSKLILENHEEIEVNKSKIWILTLTNIMLGGISIALMVWLWYNHHTIHECQEALYSKLTNQSYPFSDGRIPLFDVVKEK